MLNTTPTPPLKVKFKAVQIPDTNEYVLFRMRDNARPAYHQCGKHIEVCESVKLYCHLNYVAAELHVHRASGVIRIRLFGPPTSSGRTRRD